MSVKESPVVKLPSDSKFVVFEGSDFMLLNCSDVSTRDYLAARLAQRGIPVRVWDLDEEKKVNLTNDGETKAVASGYPIPRDVAEEAGIILVTSPLSSTFLRQGKEAFQTPVAIPHVIPVGVPLEEGSAEKKKIGGGGSREVQEFGIALSHVAEGKLEAENASMEGEEDFSPCAALKRIAEGNLDDGRDSVAGGLYFPCASRTSSASTSSDAGEEAQPVYQLSHQTKSGNLLGALYLATKTTKCPSCKLRVEREPGDSSKTMRCSQCQTTFCFACGKEMKTWVEVGKHSKLWSFSCHSVSVWGKRVVRGMALPVTVPVKRYLHHQKRIELEQTVIPAGWHRQHSHAYY